MFEMKVLQQTVEHFLEIAAQHLRRFRLVHTRINMIKIAFDIKIGEI